MAQPAGVIGPYLTNVLAVTNAVRDAILENGLTRFEDFEMMTEDDIKGMCQACRRPGGNQPGVVIPLIVEKQLKMVRYFYLHCLRTSRTIDQNFANAGNLNRIYRYKEAFDNASDPDLPDKLKDTNKVREFVEDLESHFENRRGETGVLLSYVIREEVDVPALNVDPGAFLPTVDGEMIRRAPHDGNAYVMDNKTVWTVIRDLTHGGPGWSWVSRFGTASNGRGAYLALKAHYLGASYSSKQKTEADKVLETAFFDGKSRSFTFERYLALLNQAFTDFENAAEPVPEERRVRILLRGIRDERLKVAVSTIMASGPLCATFDAAANFLSQSLAQIDSMTTSRRNVGSTNTGRGPGRGGGGRGRGRGPGRGGGGGRGQTNFKANKDDPLSIPTDKWLKMSYEEKQAVREKRRKRAMDRNRNVSSVETQEADSGGNKAEDKDTSGEVGNSAKRHKI